MTVCLSAVIIIASLKKTLDSKPSSSSRLSAGRSFEQSGPASGRAEPGPGDGPGEAGRGPRVLQRSLQRSTLPQPAALRGPVEETPVQVKDVSRLTFCWFTAGKTFCFYSDVINSSPLHASPLSARCPGGQVTVTDDSGQQRCVPSPCGSTSCRNGGVCQALSPDSYRCRCQEGFRGQRCELGQVKGHRLAALSPSSILAISMCLLVFFGKRRESHLFMFQLYCPIDITNQTVRDSPTVIINLLLLINI